MDLPVRLDFFGDTLEIDPQLRSGDAAHRHGACARSTSCRSRNSSSPPRRSANSAPAMSRPSARPRRDDLLYEAVSEGRRHPGMEHWLPLFHDRLDTLFDYLPGAPVILEPLAEDAARERLAQIADYYEARKQPLAAGQRPALQAAAAGPALSQPKANGASGSTTAALARLTPFAVPDERRDVIDVGARAGPQFRGRAHRARTPTCSTPSTAHVQALQAAGKRVVDRALERGRARAHEPRAGRPRPGQSCARRRPGRRRWRCRSRRSRSRCSASKPASRPTTSPSSASRTSWATGWCGRAGRRKRAENFIAEVTSLSAGDLVVHVDHGIGRFVGLQNIEAAGAPHDCLEIHYAGRRQAVPAGGEHRAAVALRLGGHRRRTRPARRHRLADPQGAAEEPHPRDRRTS